MISRSSSVEKGRVIDVYTKEKNGYSAVKLGL